MNWTLKKLPSLFLLHLYSTYLWNLYFEITLIIYLASENARFAYSHEFAIVVTLRIEAVYLKPVVLFQKDSLIYTVNNFSRSFTSLLKNEN